MELGEAGGDIMIIAGVGCRKGASAAAVAAAIEAAFARAGLAQDLLDAIATTADKGSEPGITAAAITLGVPLVCVPPADLQSASGRTISRSERVVALTGLPSVAEAAALAAGGPAARLLSARIAVGPVTCALADTEPAP
jgi:cobalt-precorrin 5A hydrolase